MGERIVSAIAIIVTLHDKLVLEQGLVGRRRQRDRQQPPLADPQGAIVGADQPIAELTGSRGGDLAAYASHPCGQCIGQTNIARRPRAGVVNRKTILHRRPSISCRWDVDPLHT